MKHQKEQITLFTFPATVTKGELKKRYNVSYYKLRLFIGDDLATELNWSNTNSFSPEQTAKIFKQLDPSRYEEFIHRIKTEEALNQQAA